METTEDRWLTRVEVADRLQLPVGTLADWASKGTGPRYARFGKHTRYRLADVTAWENEQMAERKPG
jgi:predicted DNA-binding transcriptional regulator AlpA